MPRRHRRVHHPETACKCPPDTKKVSTCKAASMGSVCKGRRWGCIGMRPTKKGRMSPRFVPMICAEEAGPIKQWRGKRKKVSREFIPGGYAAGMSPSTFKPAALRKGMSVEMEHTSNPSIAREIAMDHLVEDPRYYSKLRRAGL